MIQKIINMIATWWHGRYDQKNRRYYQKMATQVVNLLVTGGTSPIEIKRFKKSETPRALQISVIENESIGMTVLQSSEHAIRSVSWDDETPGCVKHVAFNERGEIVKETYITLKKS